MLRISSRTVRAFSSVASRGFPHSDLAYRALLRNLRLLTGMRGDRTNFRAVITGYNAAEVAELMKKMEPAIEFEVAGDSVTADFAHIEKLADKDLDSVIVVQPYHLLQSKSEVAVIRRCLHDVEGTLGMLWFRAGSAEWIDKFNAVVVGGNGGKALGAVPGLLPPLASSSSGAGAGAGADTPLAWIDALGCTDHAFKPVKHRKFVDKLQGSVGQLLPTLKCTHDGRFTAPAAAAAWEAGAAAAQQAAGSDSVQLPLDYHGFHTQVVPTKKK